MNNLIFGGILWLTPLLAVPDRFRFALRKASFSLPSSFSLRPDHWKILTSLWQYTCNIFLHRQHWGRGDFSSCTVSKKRGIIMKICMCFSKLDLSSLSLFLSPSLSLYIPFNTSFNFKEEKAIFPPFPTQLIMVTTQNHVHTYQMHQLIITHIPLCIYRSTQFINYM